MEMKSIARFGLIAGLCAALLAGAAGGALAQTYPQKPIRFIIPVGPGGPTDIIARIVSQKLTASLGQPVVIDNRPGAGGLIGTELAAKAPPDGYTMLMGHIGTFGTNPSLYTKLPYDPIKDFVPVTVLARLTNILMVHPSVPAKSVKELIALAKSKPGQLNYASSGNGSSQHLFMELFKTMAGVDMVHIPYKGSAPALTDLLAGQVSVMFDGTVSALPHVRAGKLRGLAVSSASRSAVALEVPTVAEAGVPGFEANSWVGVLVPKGTRPEVAAKLHGEIVKVLRLPEVKENLLSKGAEPVGNTGDEFAAFVKAEIAKWAKVIKFTGARVD